MIRRRLAVVLAAACVSFAGSAQAYTELSFSEVTKLTPAVGSSADKARILSLPGGLLLAAWHEGVGSTARAWGVDGAPHAPRDIFVRTSADNGATWSAPLNVSSTSASTDSTALYDRVGDGSGLASFYGDSSKPDVFVVGGNAVVVWNDTYCGNGVHGPARYDGPAGPIEVPYHCLYAARLAVAGGMAVVVAVDRLTDAARDATNEVVRGTGAGFALAWQEDPQGLQQGEALGEGDGASGARVSPGTDVWYSRIPAASFADPAASWSAPVPISNNYDHVLDTVLDGGASRPIMAMAGSPPSVMLVYEEAKNAGPADPGKHAVFHQFPFGAPPASQPGTIVSSPSENARRVRVVAQGTPGRGVGVRMAVLWRQGEGIHGAPADFVMRVGRVAPGTDVTSNPAAGFRATDLWPLVAVDPADSAPPLNLSGMNLDDATSVDPRTDAKAHRAVLDGDLIFAGYTQNADVDDPATGYQYFLRLSEDGGVTWMPAVNVSEAGSGAADVIEPRLLRTPATVPSGEARDVRNADVYVAAWGTQIVPAQGSDALPDALYVTRTTDRGATFERVQRLTPTGFSDLSDEAIQLRVSPDGNEISAVWIRREGGEADAVFATASSVTRTADLVVSARADRDRVDVGESVQATFSVRNAGPDAATGASLGVTMPQGLSLQGLETLSGQCDLASATCTLDELAGGATVVVTLTVTMDTAGTRSLSAQASALEVEPEPGDNAATLTVEGVPNANLAVSLLGFRPEIRRNEVLRVDYIVTNAGPQTATSLRLMLAVPAGFRVAGANGCVQSGGLLECRYPSLPVGALWRDSVTLEAVERGTVDILASVAAAEQEPAPSDNEAAATVRVIGSGGGGCSYQPGGDFDPALPLLLLLGLAQLGWRHRAARVRVEGGLAG